MYSTQQKSTESISDYLMSLKNRVSMFEAVGGILIWFFGESMLKGYLFWQFKDATETTESVNSVMQFLPLESMSNLIKEPFTRLSAVKSVAKQVGEDLSKDFSVQPLDILIVLAWTALFIYLSYALLKKRDL